MKNNKKKQKNMEFIFLQKPGQPGERLKIQNVSKRLREREREPEKETTGKESTGLSLVFLCR